MNFIAQVYRCFYNAAVSTVNHDGIEHAGYLAFLGLLSLFPFLVFVVAVIGVLGQGEMGATFITELLLALPDRVTEALKPRVTEIVSGPPQGLLTVAILGAIWTASSAVEGLRTILNRAYHVRTAPAYWLRRSLSVLQLLVFTFILVTGMILVVAMPLMLNHIGIWLGIDFLSADHAYWSRVVYLATIVALFFAVCYIYYIIPNIQQRFLSVAPGALVVVALWIAGAHLFTLYLSNFNQLNLIYGSLGGIIAALLFFYICNVIFIFGAELNYQIVHLIGMRVVQREEVTETTEE
jgi:membrane protein